MKRASQYVTNLFLRGLIGLALALLIAFTTGFTWLTEAITPDQIWLPVLGEVTWLDDLISWGAAFLLLFLSTFLMIPVASAITSMFLDDVAMAVEDKHYPELPAIPRASFAESLRDTLNFLGILIGANILALILYAFFPPFALFIFWGLNGFLLGREYFTLAAMRRLGRAGAVQLRKKHWGTIWMAGILMAAPLSIPLINLFVPILGAATFTHLYHRIALREPSG